MKTLVSTGANLGVNVSYFLEADSLNIDISGPEIVVGDMKIMAGGNWPPAEAVVHENVTTITDEIMYLKGTSIKVADWEPNKYTYNGSVWAAR